MALDGSFYVLKEVPRAACQVWEWVNWSNRWIYRGTGAFGAVGRPSPRTQRGGFHYVAVDATSAFVVGRNEPGITARPPDQRLNLSSPSRLMYGNRIYLIGASVEGHAELLERFAGRWGPITQPPMRPAADQTPCVVSDGKLVIVGVDGHVLDMWWDGARWRWHNHGEPVPSSWWCRVFGFGCGNTVRAKKVGAPMAGKFFMACSDGSLRERYFTGGQWYWSNHGVPSGLRVDTTPTAISDSKLFVTASSRVGGPRVLLERYWNGSIWVWANHGSPFGNSIHGAAETTKGANSVAVQDAQGNSYLRYWDWLGGRWRWRACGRP